MSRSVLGASALITSASILLRVATLFTSPITTRLFSTEAYGVSASVATASTIFGLLAVAGTDMGYARFAISSDFETADVERFFWRIGLAMAVLSATAAVLAWAFGLGHWLGVGRELAVPLGLAVLATGINALAATRRRMLAGYRQVAAAVVASGVIAIAFTIGSGWFWRRDAWPLVLAAPVGTMVQIVIHGVPDVRSILLPSKIDRATAIRFLRMGLPGIVTMPGFWVITSSDRWFLVRFAGRSDAGIYSIAYNLAMMGTMINGAMVMVWYPEVSRLVTAQGTSARGEIGRVWAQLVILLAAVALAIAAAGGDALRVLTPTSFHSGARLIPMLALGSFLYGVSNIANTGLFVSEEMRPIAGWWVAGSATSLALNWLLVPRIGAMGCAIALPAAFLVTTAGGILSSQRRWPLLVDWGRLVAVLFGFVLAGLVMSEPWDQRSWLSLIVKLPVGIAVVAAGLQVVAPRWWIHLRLASR